jgi:hypothetical protein
MGMPRFYLTAWALIFAIGGSAIAAPGVVVAELMPEIPVSSQDFADAIALEGNLVAVGAENTDEGSVISAGAIYLFDGTTGAQLRKITPTDPPASRAFGTSVDMSSGRIIVGAEKDSQNTGVAYVFDTLGTQLFKLRAADAAINQSFGERVAIDGNFALVGAANAVGALGRGQAYLFDLSTATPGSTLTGTPFQPNDLPSAAEFGSSIDLDGDLAIIGIDRTGRGGAAYVYNTASQLVRKFTPPTDPVTMSPVRGFGRSVSISGNIALIGATPDDSEVNESTEFGRAYLYDVTTGAQLFELRPNDSQPGDLFGEAVSISGNLALVHARREDVIDTINAAYLFDVTTGQQLMQLSAPGLAKGDEVFEAFAIDGARVVAGVEGFDASPGEIVNSGKALVFDVLFGDFNADGIVDAADYTVWRDTSGQTVAAFAGADANGDMHVDAKDYALWKANFGVAAPQTVLGLGLAGATGLPEPGTGVMLCVAIVLMACGRRISG